MQNYIPFTCVTSVFDSNANGIPDILELNDTDGDGIIDLYDTDDDNDGIPDDKGILDVDEDDNNNGIPDKLEQLDSDNDGELNSDF
ncbi:unnamed protein product [Dibothriocephalus latus]|uniref:Uncharacterized protein n=1 Tax=Dibothriocephalus latus TaxID=60516 RepID=A0A3P6PRT3_DIBLA|nr:unnamed protein product [Dibothriocephalus latus]